MAAGAKHSQKLGLTQDIIFEWMTDSLAQSQSRGKETAPSMCKVWRDFSEARELVSRDINFFYHLFLLKLPLMGDEQHQAAAWWLGENWKSQLQLELCCRRRWIEELALWFIHLGVNYLITVFSGWELKECVNLFDQSIPHQDRNCFFWPISPTLPLLRGQHLSFSSTQGLYIYIYIYMSGELYFVKTATQKYGF